MVFDIYQPFENVYVFWNRQTERYLGYTDEEAKGVVELGSKYLTLHEACVDCQFALTDLTESKHVII